MAKLFGTDGVRGEANSFLTPELAFKLGRAGGHVLTKRSNHSPSVLVAKDGRRSGDMLEAALISGLCSIGAHVHRAGMLPTPAVAYLVKHEGFDCGVMISASHNHMADNGIKFFMGDGFKLPDAMEGEIEALVGALGESDGLPRPVGADVGTVIDNTNAEVSYRMYAYGAAEGMKLDGMKIAIDCANGATSFIAERIFRRLGADVHCLHNVPNGTNINENCGSTHMGGLQEMVRKIGADCGFAFDGDGDRMLAVCEKGGIVDGDRMLGLLAQEMHAAGKLPGGRLVATVMSNQGLELFCKDNGMDLIRTDVGDRYVLERMLADGLPLGGEQSGHIIFSDMSTTGDGILTAIRLLRLIAAGSEPLSALAGRIQTLPQVLVNVAVPNGKKALLATDEAVQRCKAEIEGALAGDGRILLRPSGTEPKVRVMLEGRELGEITEMAEKLAKVIEERLK